MKCFIIDMMFMTLGIQVNKILIKWLNDWYDGMICKNIAWFLFALVPVPRQKQRSCLGEYHVSTPMDRIHVDILSPLTKLPSGDTVILMVVDHFTKWGECYPLPEQGVELLAK